MSGHPILPSELITLPLLPLRDVVVFPHMVIPLFVGRDKSMRALEQAMEADKRIILLAQKSAETDDPASVRYTHVPMAVFLAHREAILANPHPLGLLISPADKVEDVALDLGRFASIAISFPAFTDGRGYSSTRMLVERYGYAGELRAVGDVLVDEVLLMQRSGFSQAVLRADQSVAHAEQALRQFDGFYQGDAVDTAPRFALDGSP